MRKLWILITAFILACSSAAQAESKEGGVSPYAKLEGFTVNLQGLSHYLQVNIALKVAKAEFGEKIKLWDPVVRHELILLLSNQNSEELSTLEGKKALMTSIKITINKVLKVDDKEGVTAVLFESFVIQ